MSREYVNTHQFTRNRQRHSSPKSVRIADATPRDRGVISEDEEVVGSCSFIPLSMWKADVGMKGVVHPTYSFEDTKRTNSDRKVLLIEADGQLLARVDSRCSSYYGLTGQVGYPCKAAYVEWIQGWSDEGCMMFIPYNVYEDRRIVNPRRKRVNRENK